MKRKYFFSGIILFSHFSSGSFAQESVSLTELKAPSSPAFTLLGVQPTEIARPKTFEALEANLFSSFTGEENNFIIPNNYALEFSPYWLIRHPKLTYENINAGVLPAMLQNLSVSVATGGTATSTDSRAESEKMGLGVRTLIFPGKTDDKVASLVLSKLQNNFVLISAVVNTLMNDVSITDRQKLDAAIEKEMKSVEEGNADKKEIKRFIKDRAKQLAANPTVIPSPEFTSNDDAKKVLKKILDDLPVSPLNSKLKAAAKELEDVNKDPFGFILEFASALALEFPASEFSLSKVTRWGLWATPAYRLKNKKLEFIGVTRFIRDESELGATGNFDFGARLVFTKKGMSFSGEFIGRFQNETISRVQEGDVTVITKKSESDYRADATIEYKISDKIVLSYTFGRNFDFSDFAGNLISIASLNFGFGGPKIKMSDLE